MATKRKSLSIGPKQAARALHAVRFAKHQGRPLNLFVTIDTTSLGIDEDDAGHFIRRVWACLSRWWSYQRGTKGRNLGTFDAILVHESPPGGPRHIHWLFHAPPEARSDIEKVIRNRVEKLAKRHDVGRLVHFQSATGPGTLAKYMLKGIDPQYADHFHMIAHDQGEILGRRMTVSRSIGFAARKRANWKRKRRWSSAKAQASKITTKKDLVISPKVPLGLKPDPLKYVAPNPTTAKLELPGSELQIASLTRNEQLVGECFPLQYEYRHQPFVSPVDRRSSARLSWSGLIRGPP